MIAQVGKEVYNAQYRVLDHRVFVNGEIETFLNNFEKQRQDSEIESLFKVTETIGAIKYDLSDKYINLGTNNLDELLTELKTLLNDVENTITVLSKTNEPSDTLTDARIERVKRKEEIDRQFEHSYKRVQDSFAIKEEEISDLYTDLQLKLNIPK